MATARVEIHNEVLGGAPRTWRLCFQQVTYHYDDGSPDQDGFRFIWRRPDNSLQAARGQARIPNGRALDRLLTAAKAAGWF
jgi:hypothetical protein